MKAATLNDLFLILPELILVGVALVLLLLARRIGNTHIAGVITFFAGIAAICASLWVVSDGDQTAFSGMIVIDGYSQFFKILLAAALSIATLLSGRYIEGEKIARGEFHALFLLAASGMMIAASAIDLLTSYLALELMTLCSYVLVGLKVESKKSNEASIKYFLLASVASAFLLYGISMTYGLTGTTNFADISRTISEHNMQSNLFLMVAAALIVAGLGFKIAAVPFHAWAPDAYEGAITPVAAFLATGAKAAGLAAFGRICFVAFGEEIGGLSVILAALAAFSVIIGSLLAIAQTDMKRLLGYSSIAHAGFALMGLIASTPDGTSATMTYAFFYVFMTLGTFGVVIALGKRGETIDGYRGLASQCPRIAGVMLLFMLSLTGIPLTSGFIAKFGVIENAAKQGYYLVAIVAVLFSVVSAFIYMRVVVFMYMREPKVEAPTQIPIPVSLALVIVALITLIGGVYPSAVLAWTIAP